MENQDEFILVVMMCVVFFIFLGLILIPILIKLWFKVYDWCKRLINNK